MKKIKSYDSFLQFLTEKVAFPPFSIYGYIPFNNKYSNTLSEEKSRLNF